MANDPDAAAIEHTLLTLQIAFRSRNADALLDVYAADADWTNAFGTTLCGRDFIVAYLKGLFADAHFGAGQLIGPPEVSIRPVTPDVVVAKTYARIAGQQTPARRTLVDRLGHVHGCPR